jgi:hypothetical protein
MFEAPMLEAAIASMLLICTWILHVESCGMRGYTVVSHFKRQVSLLLMNKRTKMQPKFKKDGFGFVLRNFLSTHSSFDTLSLLVIAFAFE